MLRGPKDLDDRLFPRGTSRLAAASSFAIAIIGLAATVATVALLVRDGWSTLRAFQAAAGLGMIVFGAYGAARMR